MRITRSKAKKIRDNINWSNLPSDLVASIADHLTVDMPDYLRFRAVCKPWRASTLDPTRRQHPPQLPWLIVNSNENNYLSVLSLSDGRKHRFKQPPGCERTYVTLASNGWLVFENIVSLVLTLWNPITDKTVQLPTMLGIEGLKSQYLRVQFRKRENTANVDVATLIVSGIAISSSDVKSANFTVVVSFYRFMKLAWCRMEDESWTVFDVNYTYYSDVIFAKGNLYAVTSAGHVVVFSPSFERVKHISPPIAVPLLSCHKWQILESEGKVMVLSRMRGRKPVIDVQEHAPVYNTEKVNIFSLELKDGVLSLVKLNSLAGKMLFSGHCCQFVLPVDSYSLGKEDCVYFPDEYFYEGVDNVICCSKSGVFNLKDGNMEELPYDKADTSILGTSRWFTSIWHMPRFY